LSAARAGWLVAAAVGATLPLLAQQARPVVPTFVDATAASGIEFRNVCGAPPGDKGWLSESMGAGAAWLDYDLDGKLDLFLVNGSTHQRKAGTGEPNRLFKGDGKGSFVDVTAKSGLGHRGWGYGVAVGDYDNDGDPDLYVTNLGPNALFRNEGDGTFTDVTAKAGAGDPSWGTSAAFFDADGDGDLDLYVANYVDFDTAKIPRFGTEEAAKTTTCTVQGVPVFCGPLGTPPAADVLYRNEGNGKFSDATARAGLRLDVPRYALGVVSADFDRDGDSDLYVANDSVQNSMWRNKGDGTFEDFGVASMTALSGSGRPQAGMGTDAGDYNGDGWPDVVVTNFSHDLNTLYRSVEGRFFFDESTMVGMGTTNMALSWGVGLHDLDLDGDLDLFIANGHLYPNMDDYDNGLDFKQRNHLFVQHGKRFHEVSSRAGAALQVKRSFRGAAFADYDDDGDLDILLTALDEGVQLLRNETPRQGHWLAVKLEGTASNRDGVGARVIAAVPGGVTIEAQRKGGGSYLSGSDPRVHLGLGAATRLERLEVRWPSGKRDVLRGVEVDRVITVREGSSPAPAK
jgi:hypothetical protein